MVSAASIPWTIRTRRVPTPAAASGNVVISADGCSVPAWSSRHDRARDPRSGCCERIRAGCRGRALPPGRREDRARRARSCGRVGAFVALSRRGGRLVAGRADAHVRGGHGGFAGAKSAAVPPVPGAGWSHRAPLGLHLRTRLPGRELLGGTRRPGRTRRRRGLREADLARQRLDDARDERRRPRGDPVARRRVAVIAARDRMRDRRSRARRR